ncbi:MAG: hypothetical protein FRX48_08704 [Lasallia pustulata]|uniref:Helix-turn-helix domain-containing protein n=1 Tax=Lasallia pustulata TaxID=136370 RepID=A0A5M8PDU1_9LECA|nr:MAG: hypothetical protein FRX48_08704 [Lasallia pustulata]
MGASKSKVAKTAAGAARRQYPKRVPPTTNTPSTRPPPGQSSTPGPTVHPQAQASETRDQAINLDASDPDFARSLRTLGPVTPSPMYSNSSTFNPSSGSTSESQSRQGLPGSPQASHSQIFPDPARNPAILVLTARERLAQEAEEEFSRVGRKGHTERRFLDVATIRQVLMLRDEKGVEGGEIERRLGLRRGVVGKLGAKGVVGDTSMGGL